MQFAKQDTQEKLFSMAAEEDIKWHFIPPRTPNFGGIWEASVKAFKTHLKKIAGTSLLTIEEMHTFTTQIESILNSRPLIYQTILTIWVTFLPVTFLSETTLQLYQKLHY